jgi:hypothetical protein
MTPKWVLFCLLAASMGVSGCSAARLLGGDSNPATPTVQTGNTLAMPPDLQLRAPTNVSDGYQPNAVQEVPGQTANAAPAMPAAPAPAPVARAPAQDIYAQYGVSRVNPDGSPKSKGDLQRELKAAMLKKKRETQPGYGTIFNMGNIFTDG